MNRFWEIVGLIVIGSLMISVWSTDNTVNKLNNKIDDLQSSINQVNTTVNGISNNLHLTCTSTSIDLTGNDDNGNILIVGTSITADIQMECHTQL